MKRKPVQRGKPPAAPAAPSYLATIRVVGVGGGGGNAVSRMRGGAFARGVDFVAINTDAQDLDHCEVRRKIYIGKNLTRGLGTGMNPDLGRQAAEESRAEIAEALRGADLVFITAGLGGGTGSGASPLVAEIAREQGALTVAVVTKPFAFEGSQRARIAQEAFLKLKEKVDTLISVPNDRIFAIIKKDTPILKAFEHIDGVLRNSVEGIAELIATPGIVNVDFADVKTIMANAGVALVGMGVAGGQDRANHAVTQAVSSPLLEVSLEGAKGILFGISGGRDLRMTEINDVAKQITSAADQSARIIFGAYHDRKLRQGQLKVTVVATGFEGQVAREAEAMPTLFAGERAEAAERAAHESPAAARGAAARLASSKAQKGEGEKNGKGSEGKAEEAWDIPTFLRRRRH